MKKVLYYAALIIAAFLVQNNLFAACPLIHTTPNLLLIVTFVSGFIAGEREGMWVGFFCGLMLDAYFGGIIGFYALIYMATGYFNGFLGTVFNREYINTPVILSVLSDLLFGVSVYVFGYLLRGRLNFPAYLFQIILPEVIYTTAITFLVYKPLLLFQEKLLASAKRSANRFV